METHNKIPVAVLGATGAVGQRFIQLLADHPWFEIAALAASERSAGRRYADVANWVIPGDPPAVIGQMVVSPPEPDLPAIEEGTAKVKRPNINSASTTRKSAMPSTKSGFRNWSPHCNTVP